MSGIAGIIAFDGSPARPDLVRAMTSAMAHRGPDGIVQWSDAHAALGHCMMHTTPESLAGSQPLASEDGHRILVMDGRVDNHEELRSRLLDAGARLRDRSDAELVLRAHERWGEDGLEHIDGDFAFAIWQPAERRVFCARDRFGMKPLNYHWDGRRFSFASEVAPLLALPWVKAELNEGLVLESLGARWVTLDQSYWKDVWRLAPGHHMTADPKGLRKTFYWRPRLDAPPGRRSDADMIAEYRAAFTDAVRRQSRSHAPVACEVSGGLDSSAIFAVAAGLRRSGDLPAPDLLGYTLKFPAGTEADELRYVHSVAAHTGMEVTEVPPALHALAWYRQQVAATAEMPDYPNGAMSDGFRQYAANQGCRVLLAGVAGDEMLTSGRNYYADALAALDLRSLVRWLAIDIREEGLVQALRWLVRYGAFPILPSPIRKSIAHAYRRLRGGSMFDAVPWLTHTARARLDLQTGLDLVSAFNPCTAEQYKLMHSLFDPYSAWCRASEELACARLGLDLRYPFLDRKLAEFLLGIPAHMRMRGAWGKYIHREAMAGLLPDDVRWRPDKADFMMTYQGYFPDLMTVLAGLQPINEQRQWVEWSEVAREHGKVGTPDHGGWPEFMLWTLFGCLALAARPGVNE